MYNLYGALMRKIHLIIPFAGTGTFQMRGSNPLSGPCGSYLHETEVSRKDVSLRMQKQGKWGFGGFEKRQL